MSQVRGYHDTGVSVMVISVAGGKGVTAKTSVVASFGKEGTAMYLCISIGGEMR